MEERDLLVALESAEAVILQQHGRIEALEQQLELKEGELSAIGEALEGNVICGASEFDMLAELEDELQGTLERATGMALAQRVRLAKLDAEAAIQVSEDCPSIAE